MSNKVEFLARSFQRCDNVFEEIEHYEKYFLVLEH